MSAIETYTGSYFDYYNPRACDVTIEDIARALSMQCRFNGLISRFYSVAEHAVLVYRLVREAGASPEVCYAALHHDSHEAYLGDVPTPLKRTLGRSWSVMQNRVDDAIGAALGFHPRLALVQSIKAADSQALLIEAAVLKTSHGIGEHWDNEEQVDVPAWAVRCYEPFEAEKRFLYMHRCARADLPVVGVGGW